MTVFRSDKSSSHIFFPIDDAGSLLKVVLETWQYSWKPQLLPWESFESGRDETTKWLMSPGVSDASNHYVVHRYWVNMPNKHIHTHYIFSRGWGVKEGTTIWHVFWNTSLSHHDNFLKPQRWLARSLRAFLPLRMLFSCSAVCHTSSKNIWYKLVWYKQAWKKVWIKSIYTIYLHQQEFIR